MGEAIISRNGASSSIVDQFHNPLSENAQSGKAVAEAVKDGLASVSVYENTMDTSSVIFNDESNMAGSYGFSVVTAEKITDDELGTCGKYQIKDPETDEDKQKLIDSIEKFNNLSEELNLKLEAGEITNEEIYKELTLSAYLFDPNSDESHRHDGNFYISNITEEDGKYYIYTIGYANYFSGSDLYPSVADGSYIRIMNHPEIGLISVDLYSFAAGINNKALGDGAFAAGMNNVANGAYSFTVGRNNYAAYNGAAFGRYNTINGQMGAAFGQYNTIDGHDSLAAGLKNKTTGREASAFGIMNTASGEAQTVVGAANKEDEDAAFIVGNGKYDRSAEEPTERSNAFVVKKNGNVDVNGDSIFVNGNNILNKSIIEIADKLPEIGETNKIYAIKNETNSKYIYLSKTDEKGSKIWDGTLATNFSSGTGVEEDPYIIESPEQLATAINGKMITYTDTEVQGNNYLDDVVIGDGEASYYYPHATNGSFRFVVDYSEPYVFNTGYTNGETFTEITITDLIEVPEGCYLACSTSGPSEDWYITDSSGSKYETIIEKTETSKSIAGSYFKLAKNIYLNDISRNNWKNSASNHQWFIGAATEYYTKDLEGNDTTEPTVFSGHIDGDGYTIYGLWYANDRIANSSHISSLIPAVQDGTEIKNLGISNSQIVSFMDLNDGNDGSTVRGQSAGFIANAKGSSNITIDNCYIDENVDIYTDSRGSAAGFFGYARSNSTSKLITISNCYSLVTNLKGQSIKCNGFIGEVWNTYFTIENCYSITKVFDGASASAIPKGTLSNVYSIMASNNSIANIYTVISKENMQGDNSLINMNIGDAFGSTKKYPALKIFNYGWKQINESSNIHIWDGTLATNYSSGTGTETDPYIIETPEQFALMVENFGGGGEYFSIMNDLYFNNINLDKSKWSNKEWYCDITNAGTTSYTYDNKAGISGTFNGRIDGNGHSIYGLYHINTDHFVTGLIPTMGNGFIKNLALKNSELYTSGNVAGFIGKTARDAYPNGTVMIENCYVDADVILKSISSSGVAGFIGYAASNTTTNIKNCYCLTTNITGVNAAKTGAIIGESWDTAYMIWNCYAIGALIATDDIRRLSTFTNAYSSNYSAYSTTNSYFDITNVWTPISQTNMQGIDALILGTKMPNLGENFISNLFYPKLKCFCTPDEIIGSEAYAIVYKLLKIRYGSDIDGSVLTYMKLQSILPASGTASVTLDGEYANIEGDLGINLNTSYGVLNYNGKEVATKEDIESKIIISETEPVDAATGTIWIQPV